MNRGSRWLLAAALGFAACSSGDDSEPDVGGTQASDPPDSESPSLTRFESAAVNCSMHDALADSGTGLIFNGEGVEDSTGDGIAGIVCVLVALDAPQTFLARLDSTRALDGTLSSEWSGINASWSYHPDSGLNLILEDTETDPVERDVPLTAPVDDTEEAERSQEQDDDGCPGQTMVQYLADGDGRATTTVRGPTRDAQLTSDMPHPRNLCMDSGADLLLRVEGEGAGTFSCSIVIGGEVIAEEEADGGSVAECEGTVP